LIRLFEIRIKACCYAPTTNLRTRGILKISAIIAVVTLAIIKYFLCFPIFASSCLVNWLTGSGSHLVLNRPAGKIKKASTPFGGSKGLSIIIEKIL